MGEYLKRNGRLLLAAVVIVLFCAALPELFAAGKAIETGSWGLSFREEGKEPVGNASRQALESYDAVYVGDGKEKVIYLTFDAGFENGYTASILDTLQAHNAPACFFVVGNYLETAPELVRRMVNEGHIVGTVSYTHLSPRLACLGQAHRALQHAGAFLQCHHAGLAHTRRRRSCRTGGRACPRRLLRHLSLIHISLEISHNLRYAVFRWYGYEHMDMILPCFRFMNLDTLILAQLSDHLSDILFDLSVYDLSPVFRCEYDMIFTFPLRSVYKELHADHETGAADNK